MNVPSLSIPFAALAGALLLGGCVATSEPASVFDVTSFDDCREEALALDAAARQAGAATRYAQAGRLAKHCVAEAGPDYGSYEADAQRLHLLSVLDLLRGGHVAEAREQLLAFERRFPGRDLRDSDQTSLVDALGLLLSVKTGSAGANVSRTLVAEIDRIEHWQHR